MSRRTLILPIGAGVIGQDDVPLVRIMDSDETPTSITIYGVVDTVQPVESVTWTVNGVEQTGDVSRSPVLELTDLQPETSYAITLRATNVNGQSQASARTIWTKKITTITPADVIDGVSYYDYQDVYRTGTMPERDETDITVSGRDVTVPAGHYAESETVSVSSEYIIPTGTKNINTNGTEDVTQYANVNVNVPASAVDTGTKQTNITTNGTQTVDVVGYANNEVTVNVPASAVDSGTKQITSNGNGQDVVGYAAVDVDVQPNLTTLNVNPSTNAQVIFPSNVDGWDEVDVAAVTSAIDANITAGNIKKDVTILGVTGTLEQGIQPTGTLNIINNGTYDITNYANVTVQVASGDFNELCFTALQANSTLGMQHRGTNAGTTKPTVYYSIDNRQTWNPFVDAGITLPNVGDKIYVYGQNVSGFNYDESNSSYFSMSGQFSVSGNIMSLITRYGDRDIPNGGCFCWLFFNQNALVDASGLVFPSMTIDDCYYAMFYGCRNLVTGPAILPAMEVKSRSYFQMFWNCSSLTNAPELPATELANSCYCAMFRGCTGLTVAPALPATTLAVDCYDSMFYGCTGITKAPWLPAKLAADSSYYRMFSGCRNLSEISVGILEWSDYNAREWVNNVAASGTFYKMKDINITVDSINGIPTGWTVVEIPVVVDDNNEISLNAAAGTTIYYTTDGSTPTTSSTLYTGPIDARSIGDKFTLKYLSVYNNTELPIMEYTYYYAFYVEALENGTVLNTSNWRNGMVYSTDKQAWNSCQNIANNQFTLTSTGDKVYFKRASVDGVQVNVGNLTTVSGTIKVGGYIEFVATGDITNNATLTNKVGNMFQNCTGLVDASDLILIDDMSGYDAGYVDTNGPYYCMFDGCTSLTATPVFRPAILNHMAYQYMFRNCTSLVNAPNLPTTSDNGKRRIYRKMFYGCTSLVNGPTIGLTGSFQWQDLAEMFSGCTNLVSVAVPNITNWNTSNAENWLYGVATNGVVIVPDSNTSIPLSSASGIPSGWVRVAPKTTPNAYDVKMTRNSVWVVLQNEWPNGRFILGEAKASDGGDFVGSDYVEVYVQNGHLNYDDNWTGYQNPYGQFYNALSHTFANGTGLYLEFEMETGYEIDFDGDFKDCSDWQTQGYSSYDDCMCTENHTNCPPEYLCFTAEQANSTVALTIPSGISVELYKSTDGTNFTSWDGSAITLANVGDKVYLYGENDYFATSYLDNANYHCNFTMTGQIAASGDITTLLTQQGTTTLSYPCTFARLFQYCTSLTTPPTLPATTLSEHCYNGMFESCSALTTAPTLPATSFPTQLFYGGGCYANMFRYCTSLTTSPTLSATTPCSGCYDGMFYGCTNLNTVICLATDVSATDCTLDWLYGVSATGTFTKATSMSSWTTGDSGIPNGWTVVNA